MIEFFDAPEFEEKALSTFSYQRLGIQDGEHTYLIEIPGDRVAVKVRSSIRQDGESADTGKDSIRAWLVNLDAPRRTMGSKTGNWVNRLPGWGDRTREMIAELIRRRMIAGDCPDCHQPKLIFQVKNPTSEHKGRLFAKCGAHGHWVWLDEQQEPERSLMDLIEDTAKGEEPDEDLVEMIEDAARDEISTLPVITADEITLNQFQQEFVNSPDGPSVVEAVPGSGKTRAAEYRVAALLERGINPARLGFFTFTKNAASEARWRIARTLWPDASPAELAFFAEPGNDTDLFRSVQEKEQWLRADPRRQMIVDRVCTIHALSYRLLRWHGYQLNVLDGSKFYWDEKNLIRDALDELEWDESPKSVSAWIAFAINNLVLPARSQEWFTEQLEVRGGPIHVAGNLAEVYRRRQDFMKAHSLIDYDMMQARCLWLIRNNPVFKKWVTGLFDHIIVDEAQDTAPIQSEILFTLAERSRNITYIGDVDQSMYKFRGAQPEVLRSDFEAVWPDVTRFTLPINYRSTKAIIDGAAKLIVNNYPIEDAQYLKEFQARPGAPEGVPLEYIEVELFDDMGSQAAALTVNNPGDWYILSRTRAECAAIHMELVARNIPAINKSGGLLLGAKHIRKVLGYLRLAADWQGARDDLEILEEVSNVATVLFRAPFTVRRHRDGCTKKSWEPCGCPIIREEDEDYCHTRYIAKKTIQRAGSWNGLIKMQDERNRGGYLTTAAKGAQDLVHFVERLERGIEDAQFVLDAIIQDCVLPWLQRDEGISDEDLAENGKSEDFDVLLQLIEPEMTVAQFLEKIDSLAISEKPEDEAVSVLLGTYHWAKGSERKRVIVNTTRLPIVPPPSKPGKLPTGSPPSIPEERRLVYVGITRAKEQAILMGAREWQKKEIDTSPFVLELMAAGVL